MRASIKPTVCSAIAWGEYAGTRSTSISSRSAAATSTWLKPAERRQTRRTPSPLRRSSTEAEASSRAFRATASQPCASSTVSPLRRISVSRSSCPRGTLAASKKGGSQARQEKTAIFTVRSPSVRRRRAPLQKRLKECVSYASLPS